MKDTLRFLANNPEVGIGTSFLSTLIGILDVLNPILTFISLSFAITLAIMTLYAKFKAWFK